MSRARNYGGAPPTLCRLAANLTRRLVLRCPNVVADGGHQVMDLSEMREHLETIARCEGVALSARVRAIEVLLRIAKQQTPEDAEWDRIVREFGDRDIPQ
jgi:hypothetical protein